MNDSNEKNDKTLTISSSRLTLNKPVSDNKFTQSIQGKINSVTVVKKKRIFNREEETQKFSFEETSSKFFKQQKPSSTQIETKITEQERLERLKALVNAADDNAKIFESKNLQRELKVENSEEKTEDLNLDFPSDASASSSEKPIEIDSFQKSEKNKISTKKEQEEDLEEEKKKDKAKLDIKNNKSKFELINRRSSGKININAIRDEEDAEQLKTRSLASLKRARDKAKKSANDRSRIDGEKIIKEVIVPELISVQELANRMSIRTTDVIKELMKLGMIVTSNQEIDADTAEIIVETFGHTIKKVSDSDIEKIFNMIQDDPKDLVKRAPVITIMGHVDHGKTSLLDALRETDVAAKEAGGITQHIGAYRITLPGGDAITFIDTPGHAAFTAMRARGAEATDIIVLVVAADDGIMEQTKEAINHAKAASVPIIVAINKIDKPDANSQKVRNDLLNYDLVLEEFGGDIIAVDVSAKSKINLDKLEEAILLQAEMLSLKANPNARASGVVIESKLDKNRGVVVTLLVQRGTIKVGDIVIAGSGFGKVKTILNDKGDLLQNATPSMPVEILGFNTTPESGEKFVTTSSEKQARDLAEYKEKKAKIHKNAALKKGSLEELFAISSNGKKELAIILKADVQGSIEAITGSLAKLPNNEIRIKIIHSGVGGITQSDVVLATASKAFILGFNVRPDLQAKIAIESSKVDIRYYSIIYNLIDDMKAVLGGMLSPIIREIYTGTVKILQVFNITKSGKIAGCIVTDGIVKQNSNIRLLRDSIVIYEGKMKTLKRYKEDVKEVKEGQECGIALQGYEDIKDNDVIEIFEVTEEKQKIS